MELQQQRQADTRFRGGEGDGEDIHYLAIGLAPVAPCNHESQRRGIDHDLQANQHKQQIAADNQPRQAEDKQDRGEDQSMC